MHICGVEDTEPVHEISTLLPRCLSGYGSWDIRIWMLFTFFSILDMSIPLPIPTIVTTIEQYLCDAPIPSHVHAALDDCTLDRLPDMLLKTCASVSFASVVDVHF